MGRTPLDQWTRSALTMARRYALLRIAVIFLASIETLLAASFIALMLQSTDPLGKAIGEGMTRLLAMPLVLLVLPALALGLAEQMASGGDGHGPGRDSDRPVAVALGLAGRQLPCRDACRPSGILAPLGQAPQGIGLLTLSDVSL